MTEAEWFAEPDFARHVRFVEDRLSERKRRLLACAFCRAACERLDADLIGTLAVVERYADGAVGAAGLEEARKHCRAWAVQAFEVYRRSVDLLTGDGTAALARHEFAWAMAFAATSPFSPAEVGKRVLAAEPSVADALRDRVWEVVGNPFAAPFDPQWRTSTAVGMAGQVYESGDFSPMPILADALQDAGCDRDDILDHCRDAKQVHVRGCWVLDAVLGKG